MKIIKLTNKEFTGDNNQLQGILLALMALKTEIDHSAIEEAELNIDALTPDAIVLAAGDHGMEQVIRIKERFPGVRIVWSGHQFFEALNHRTVWPDVVALPETAVTAEQAAYIRAHTHLELTKGVAHCVNEETVSVDFSRFKGELPKDYTTCIGIVLAGDAPTESREMRFFTAEDAREQAKLIASHIKSNGLWHEHAAVMVTNGPRTGKHNPVTGKPVEPEPHRAHAIDASSAAFLAELSVQLPEAKIHFYDFQFDALKEGPSAYKPMMHLVANSRQGIWYVPSESISMVTESTYLAEKGVRVVAYHPGSENDSHLRHAADYLRLGIVTDITAEHTPALAPVSTQTAASQIAQTLVARMSKLVIQPYLSLTTFGRSDKPEDAVPVDEPARNSLSVLK
ncbi:hypothetical protein [Legionella nagasakiensis]|uniref:hypothetical protein n=1 Tax=Legionella nagasakiensis TaxID=535290 RepID=UPI001056016D|nr:hypothetical protein [Legionella nagasakiensis]